MNAAPLACDHLKTQGLSPSAAHDMWTTASQSSVGRLYDTRPYQPFAAEVTRVALDPFPLFFSRLTGQRFDRTAAQARRDGADQLTVSVRFRGGARGMFGDRAVDGGEGSIVLNDLAQPQWHVSDACESAYFAIPRGVAERLLPPVRDLHGVVIGPRAGALLTTHLHTLRQNIAHVPATQAARLGGTILDLLAVALADQVGLAAPAHAKPTVDLRRAKAVIDQQLDSPGLTVTSLCRMLGVSRSQLYRLFEAEDGVQAYIRARRLDRVAASLTDPACDDRIVDLADRYGFCDAAYLARIFRERYGMAPAEFRALNRAAP